MTAEGSVGDFDDAKRDSLKSSIAAVAGDDVDASAVTVAITPGSVIITATIAVPASTTAEAVQTSLASKLSTADAARTELGIPVESVPNIAVTTSPATPVITNPTSPSPPPPSSPSPPPPSESPPGATGGATGGADDSTATALEGESDGGGGAPTAAIGGGAAVAILLAVGLGCYYLGKKRMAGGSQSPVAQTAISLSPTKERDLESGAPATKGPTATYSVELTKTPMGLGLSLADDVVTEVKPDSQAARGGRIKVWASSRVTVRVRVSLT